MAAQPPEPILTPAAAGGRIGITQAPSSLSTMAVSTVPMYGMPPGFMPPVATQAPVQPGIGGMTTTFQNPLYTNTIMANLSPLGSLPGPSIGTNTGNQTGPMYPNMPRTMPLTNPSYTNESLATFRQQLEESHHELVNMLTHQMATVITPIIESNNTRYEQLARQVNRIASIVDNVAEPINQPRVGDETHNLGPEHIPAQPENQIIDDIQIVNRGQNADQVLQRLRQNNAGGHHNLTRAVEQVLNHFGFNVGYANQPHFVSAFPDYVQQVEIPQGRKPPKSLTKFSGESGESTVEHIARYTMEID